MFAVLIWASAVLITDAAIVPYGDHHVVPNTNGQHHYREQPGVQYPHEYDHGFAPNPRHSIQGIPDSHRVPHQNYPNRHPDGVNQRYGYQLPRYPQDYDRGFAPNLNDQYLNRVTPQYGGHSYKKAGY